MIKQLVVFCISLALGTSTSIAFAQSTPSAGSPASGPKTRAEVEKATKAKAGGGMAAARDEYVVGDPPAATKKPAAKASKAAASKGSAASATNP